MYCLKYDKEAAEKIKERCIQAEPDKGPIWEKYHKEYLNWDLGSAQILELAVQDAEKHFGKL